MWTDQAMMQDYPVPEAMGEAEIEAAIEGYVQASRNAIAGGLHGVELHGANGYLIDPFLNTASNQRDDRWGGSIENRARFAIEVARRVVEAIGGERVGMRLSPCGIFSGMRPDAETTATPARSRTIACSAGHGHRDLRPRPARRAREEARAAGPQHGAARRLTDPGLPAPEPGERAGALSRPRPHLPARGGRVHAAADADASGDDVDAAGTYQPDAAELTPFASFSAAPLPIDTDGLTLAVGHPNSGVIVYRRVGGAWQQEHAVGASPAGVGAFGASVAVDGDRVLVGAPSTAGGVVIYARDPAGAWSQQTILTGPDGKNGDRFGKVLALDGDTLAVSSQFGGCQPMGNNHPRGHVRIFQRQPNGNWQATARIQPGTNAACEAVVHFGRAMALDADDVILASWSPGRSGLPGRIARVDVFEPVAGSPALGAGCVCGPGYAGPECDEQACGSTTDCDDGNPCTADACVEPFSANKPPICNHAPTGDYSPCNDGDACNTASGPQGLIRTQQQPVRQLR